jgi:hypothetical protein
VPEAIKRDLKDRDQGLITLLMESQNLPADELGGFMLKNFPTSEARVAINRGDPLPPSQGIPYAGLIGVDGTLLWVGNPLENPKKLEEMVDAELKKRKDGFGPTPEVRKVRALLYGKSNYAEAKKAADAVADAEAKTKLAGEIEATFARSLKAVTALQDDGRYLAAKSTGEKLLRSVAGVPDYVEQATKANAVFATPEAAKELAADAKVEKFLKGAKDLKGDAYTKAFAALRKSIDGTKAASRLDHYAKIPAPAR